MSGEGGQKKKRKVFMMRASNYVTYIVEAIRDKRINRGQVEYLIKWEGWPESDNTWEPEKYLKDDQNLIDQFEERLKSETICDEEPKRKSKRRNGDDANPSKAATSSSSRPQEQGLPNEDHDVDDAASSTS